MRGIILAAGSSRRLGIILGNKPKCLLEFGGKSLIKHQINALANHGIKEFVIVVGYEKGQIIDHLKKSLYKLNFIENPIYAKTNTIYSLWLARNFFDEDFIYFNADVLFDYTIIKKLIETSPKSTFACNSAKCLEEEVKVILKGNRILEIGKKLAINKCFGEFVGIAKFVKDDNILFKKILDDCIKDNTLWNNYFEYAVNILAKKKELICLDISDLPAIEIDFPEDLVYAKNIVFPQLCNT
jgi:choline kinase